MIDPDGTGQSGVVWKKTVCVYLEPRYYQSHSSVLYIFICSGLVAEQTLSISVVGTAQLTTGIIKHTIGFFINDLEHLLSIPFKSCYHKLLYLINTGHNSPLDHKSHNGLLLINNLNLCAPTVIS